MNFRITIIVFMSVALAACRPPAAPPPTAAPPAERIPATLEEAAKALAEGRKEIYEKALRNLASSSETMTRRRALVTLGLFYRNEKRDLEALQALRLAIPEYPELSSYLQLQTVELDRRLKNYSGAALTARNIIAAAPSSSAAGLARLQLPALLSQAGDAAGARESAAAISTHPFDEFTEGEFVRTADALASSGQQELATAIRFRLLTQYPQSRYTEKTYGNLTALSEELSPLSKMSFDELMNLAEKLGRVNRYDQALDLLNRIEQRFPDRTNSAELRYVRVQSLFNSRNYEQVTQLTAVENEPYFVATQMLRGRAYWRSDRSSEFVAMMNEVIAKYPASKEATQARLQLGKYYITDETDYPRAINFLESVTKAGEYGNEGENLWTLGWIHTLAGQDQKALDVLADYVRRYPDSDYTTNALFWSGKIHQRRGDTAARDAAYGELTRRYPYAYYSYRARELTGVTQQPANEIASGFTFPLASEKTLSESDPKFVVVRELASIGLLTEAAAELKKLVADRPDDALLAFRLADLYSRAGEAAKGMGILQRRFRDIVRHGGSGVPPRFWQILYPRLFWDQLTPAAVKQNVDPYMLTAIIRQESGFDPSVVSNAGAVGLMQIMPAESARLGEAAGLPGLTRGDLFDPAKSAQVGAAEFAQKLQLMDGNVVLAIASYNAGETAVRGWLARTPLDDLDLFIESIPYNETRLYVKNVTRNHREYRRIYEQPAP